MPTSYAFPRRACGALKANAIAPHRPVLLSRRVAYALAGLAVCAMNVAHASDAARPPLIKPLVDVRVRYEFVDQAPLAEDANAVTTRARLGFETRKLFDTALLVEGDFVWPLVTDYNSTTNGKTQYPIVADPESYEFNRLQLANTSLPGTTVTLGRQRIALDDHRFVGNVGWRQNEQTFDALRIVNNSIKGLTLDASYVTQVNRVFGKESPQGRYESESVLLNASYATSLGKLSAFGYVLEFDPIPNVAAALRDSSSTYGVRFAGERPAGAAKLGYAASWATQEERGDNPLTFDNDYYFIELSAAFQQWKASAGYEVLGGDGVKGFTTPLATLHKFQGWADKFLTTPVNGVEDMYVSAMWSAPKIAWMDALNVTAVYHEYSAERTSVDYGEEVNLQVLARKAKLVAILKFADYSADAFATDTRKWWAEVNYAF